MNLLKKAILTDDLTSIKLYEKKGINFLNNRDLLKHISHSISEYDKQYYLTKFPKAKTSYFNRNLFSYFHNKHPFSKELINKYLSDVIKNDSLNDYLFFQNNNLIYIDKKEIYNLIIKNQSSIIFHYLWTHDKEKFKNENANEFLNDTFYYIDGNSGNEIFNTLFNYCEKHDIFDLYLLSEDFVDNFSEYNSDICLKLLSKGVRVSDNKKHFILRKLSNFSFENFTKFLPYFNITHEEAIQLMYNSLEGFEFEKYHYMRDTYNLSLDDKVALVFRTWDLNGQISSSDLEQVELIKEVNKNMPYLCTKDHVYYSPISSISMAQNLNETLNIDENKGKKVSKKI